jgi:hypothetical protein
MILQEEDTGETLNWDDMFIVSHTKKDGNPMNATAGEDTVSTKYVILFVDSSFHLYVLCRRRWEKLLIISRMQNECIHGGRSISRITVRAHKC